MNLSCEQLDALLPEFFDGALVDPALTDALDHLATCDSCRLTVAELRSVGDLYREHRLAIPEDSRARILEALQEDGRD